MKAALYKLAEFFFPILLGFILGCWGMGYLLLEYMESEKYVSPRLLNEFSGVMEPYDLRQDERYRLEFDGRDYRAVPTTPPPKVVPCKSLACQPFMHGFQGMADKLHKDTEKYEHEKKQ